MDVKIKPPLEVVRPNPNVIFRRLGDEIVLFHLQTDRFYELNASAARFWELVCAGSNPTQVREQMIEEFMVEPDQFTSEAEALLDSFRKEDLVSVDE
jgi:Coenzyme PQQ synthesis protein D (PqqD)